MTQSMNKKISVIFAAAFLVFSQMAFAAGKEINVKVKGLVCAFCVKNIEKSFLKNDAVEKVKADLDTKIVTINLKEGKTLSDEVITETISDAGYNVTTIER